MQLLLNHIDFGLAPAESVIAPRFMTDHFLGSFRQKPPALGRLRDRSRDRRTLRRSIRCVPWGTRCNTGTGPLGAAPSVIAVDPRTGLIRVAGDPRAGRHALAY